MNIGDPQTMLRGKYGQRLQELSLAPTVAQMALALYPGPAPATIASAATIAPQTDVFIVSGTVQIDTITLPPGMAGRVHTLKLLPTGLFTISTSGNVGLGVTAKVGE